MDPLTQTGLQSLMRVSSGRRDITIGIIDGPVDLNHPAFRTSNIRTIRDSQSNACNNASSIACSHGTFVTGIVCAKRGVPAPAICPDCQVILNPIFREGVKESTSVKDMILPSSTAEELSIAIIETVDAGARIINLSLGLSTSSLTKYEILQQAYDYSLQKGVIIVVATGNQHTSLINHHWLIPVAVCDEDGKLDPISNFGPSIGNRGVMAPGINIRSTYPTSQYTNMSGTSFAVPFVTGALALLWSIFPKAGTAEMISAIRSAVSVHSRKSIMPPLVDIEAAYLVLKSML